MVLSYTREDLIHFLSAMDREMTHYTELVVIGGASLTLAYNFSNTTIDMDLLNRITSELKQAIQKATESTRLEIKVSTANVYAPILNFESRLQVPSDLESLKKLKIFVPEKHDLALMKGARSEARDLDDIRGLHRSSPLNPEVLHHRFRVEILPLNSGDDELAKDKYLGMIELLFGEELAVEHENKLAY